MLIFLVPHSSHFYLFIFFEHCKAGNGPGDEASNITIAILKYITSDLLICEVVSSNLFD